MEPADREVCPACGGAGGGPFGRTNSGWDIETYECTRCEGWGYLRESAEPIAEPPAIVRPGLAKTSSPPAKPEETAHKKRSSRISR